MLRNDDNADLLRRILEHVTYRSNWEFALIGPNVLQWTLQVKLAVHCSQDDDPIVVEHRFPVPDYSMGEKSMLRFLLECIVLVEQHEACELFKVEGVSVFLPNHTGQPYMIPEAYANTERAWSA